MVEGCRVLEVEGVGALVPPNFKVAGSDRSLVVVFRLSVQESRIPGVSDVVVYADS